MRIAMIGQKGIPAQSGGVEQHVDVLSRELAARGHEVLVYCRRSYCDGRTDPAGTPVRRIFRASVPTKHLDAITHTVTSTFDVILRRADVVHYHAIGPAALAPLARLGGLPVVVTCHGLDWQRAKWGGFAKRCLKLGEWLAAKSASRLISVSPVLCDHFDTHYGVRPTFIPNGVMTIEHREPARMREFGIAPGRFILAVARLVPEKGLHYLIRAFADAASNIAPDVRLVIAGGGGLDASYERELHQLANDRVVFTGPADRELIAELYSHAMLFALPSDLEGMSIALLEAMSMGRPVLVSDIPENTCVVEGDGFTFRRGDVAHLSNALAGLIADPDLLRQFGERARRRAERYRWSKVANELEAVYRAVAGQQADTTESKPAPDIAETANARL